MTPSIRRHDPKLADPRSVVDAAPGENARSSRGSSPGKTKKPYPTALFFGLLSLSGYVLLFRNERLVTSTFTLGGWNTLLPVFTAFFFSFVHGAFASNLLSILGLEAKK